MKKRSRSSLLPTITIRLPAGLKLRVAAAAKRTGTTPHRFIVNAIADKVAQEERLGDINDVAEKRFARIVTSGKTVPWNEMRRYLEDRATGNAATRPRARKLAR